MDKNKNLLPLVLAAGLFLVACGADGATENPEAIPVVVDDISVIAEGQLVPTRFVQLSFAAPGIVTSILADEGQSVESGELVAQLGSRQNAEAQLAGAQLELVSAQQAYDTLLDEVDLRGAEASLALANARDELEDTEYHWRVQQPGNRANGEVLAQAEASLILVDQELDAAESRYNRLSGRPTDNPGRAAARSALAAVRQERDSILRRLNWYKGAPTENDQMILDAEVAIAQANVLLAEQDYQGWFDGPDPDELALAEARLTNAQAQVAAAEIALADTEIRAPFSGMIAEMSLKVGEQVTPGLPVVFIADMSEWMIETNNLTEIEVPSIAVGQSVEVAFDALPNLMMAGTVTSINPLFQEVRGDITYVVEIALEEFDERLQWGMTSVVTFE